MCVCVCVYHIVFFHSFIDRHLGYFPALATVSNYRASASKDSDVGWHQAAASRTGGWPGLCLPTWKKSSTKLTVPVRWVCHFPYYSTAYMDIAGLISSEKTVQGVSAWHFFSWFTASFAGWSAPMTTWSSPLSGPASKVNPSTHHRLRASLPSPCLGPWLCSAWDCLFLLWAATSSSSLSACHWNLIVSYMPFPISISHGA